MAITIDGTGTITGVTVGGLPDGIIATADLAAGAVTQAKRSEDLTLDTAKASTSGTSVDFTGIPSWVKRVTVMFSGVSTSGTSQIQIQLGTSGGFQTSGYAGSSDSWQSAPNAVLYPGAGFIWDRSGSTAAFVRHGIATLAHLGSNTWIFALTHSRSETATVGVSAGSTSLSGTLTQLRITTLNGTDTFDAGSINIMYE